MTENPSTTVPDDAATAAGEAAAGEAAAGEAAVAPQDAAGAPAPGRPTWWIWPHSSLDAPVPHEQPVEMTGRGR